jgi:hypothetical protein
VRYYEKIMRRLSAQHDIDNLRGQWRLALLGYASVVKNVRSRWSLLKTTTIANGAKVTNLAALRPPRSVASTAPGPNQPIGWDKWEICLEAAWRRGQGREDAGRSVLVVDIIYPSSWARVENSDRVG